MVCFKSHSSAAWCAQASWAESYSSPTQPWGGALFTPLQGMLRAEALPARRLAVRVAPHSRSCGRCQCPLTEKYSASDRCTSSCLLSRLRLWREPASGQVRGVGYRELRRFHSETLSMPQDGGSVRCLRLMLCFTRVSSSPELLAQWFITFFGSQSFQENSQTNDFAFDSTGYLVTGDAG